MHVGLKINGINTPATMHAALTHGVEFIGFPFHSHPSRQIGPGLAGELARDAPTATILVGIFADPTDVELEECMAACPVDMVQLHGRESPERVSEIKRHLNLPIIKTIRLRTAADAARADLYVHDADHFLFGPSQSAHVRAIGQQEDWAFDWRWLRDYKHRRPWFLSGGIAAENLATAAADSGAVAFDITGGVEQRPGVICLEKLKILCDTAAALCAKVAP